MSITSKCYNPKSNMPAVYIPTWLIQVPSSELSLNAKLLYGRLAQWSNNKGTVNRSSVQLAEEIGSTKRTVGRILQELRDVGLIETFQAEKGGVNHFKFNDHNWIHRQLLDVLGGKIDQEGTTISGMGVVPNVARGSTICGIPKVKEVKRSINKPIVDSSNQTVGDYKKDKLFMAFYNNYPNKQKPRIAYKAFLKLKPDQELTDKLVADVSARSANNWKDRPTNKIPHPATYLNAHEWEGEIILSKDSKQDKNEEYIERHTSLEWTK